MRDAPILTFRDSRNRPVVEGFTYLWLKYVVGFDPAHHCAQCLIGPYDDRFGGEVRFESLRTRPNESIVLDRAPFEAIYLCGNSGTWKLNLHIAAISAPGESFSVPTYNGFQVVCEHLRKMPILPLPKGWRGLPDKYTTCRNFQFGVGFYGMGDQ